MFTGWPIGHSGFKRKIMILKDKISSKDVDSYVKTAKGIGILDSVIPSYLPCNNANSDLGCVIILKDSSIIFEWIPLKDLKLITRPQITIDIIERAICQYWNLTQEELHENKRNREIVQARQTAMYFAIKKCKLSLSKIAKEIGNKDHATAIHARKTIENLMFSDKSIRKQINELDRIISKYVAN